MGRAARAVALAAAMVLGGSCGTGDGDGSGPAGDGPLVLATTSVWADITSNVACDGLARVRSIIPPGADSHSFEPSLADRARLEEAALVVVNGLDLEQGLADTLDAARDDGADLFVVADHLDALATAGPPLGPGTSTAGPGSGSTHDDDDHDGASHDDDPAHDQGDHDGASHDDEGDEDHGADGASHEGDQDHDHAVDPHLWLDPGLVDQALGPLGDALVERAGLDRAAVGVCTDRYRDRLAALDAEVEATVAAIPPERRRLVTSHGSLDHFAARYGFEVLGTVLPSTSSLAEASPGALEDLARRIEQAGVPAVFTDAALDDRDTAALARRLAGVTVVDLHLESLGGPGTGAETYLDLVRANARLIAEGLAGTTPSTRAG